MTRNFHYLCIKKKKTYISITQLKLENHRQWQYCLEEVRSRKVKSQFKTAQPTGLTDKPEGACFIWWEAFFQPPFTVQG